MIEVILSVGVINGLTLGVLLMVINNGSPVATRLYGMVLATMALIILETLLIKLGLQFDFPHFLRSTDTLFLLMLPALYLHALLITERKRKLTKWDLLHLIPFLGLSMSLIPFYSLDGASKLSYQNSTEVAISGFFKGVVGIMYFTLTLVHMIKVRRGGMLRSIPMANRQNVTWFYRVLLSLIASGTLSLLLFTLQTLGFQLPIDSDTFVSILLTVIFYIHGFVLLRNPYLLWGTSEFQRPVEEATPKPQYRTSPLSANELEIHLGKLMEAMRSQGAFKDPQLSPKSLEDLTGIRAHYITETLNTLLNRNFYEFVNAYRVEEMQRLLKNPSNDHLTILALAYQAGFNSKASFNRIFKQYVGKSPTQFKKECRANQ